MTNLLTIEMDCWSDDCVDEVTGELNLAAMAANILSSAKAFNIRAKLVDECGPGGGCPVFAYTGTEPDLRAFLKVWHNPGLEGQALEDEIDFYLEEAEPA